MTDPGNGTGFGDAAGTSSPEAEAPAPQGASAGAPHPHATTADEAGPEDTSGVSDWVEEGGPLEPSDVEDVEGVEGVESVAVSGTEMVPAAALAERTADLQRLTAEYANYRKRTERDRRLVAETERYKVLVPIIDVLDTIDRAREHGDLEDGLRSVADQLQSVVQSLGLSRFGEVGDAFDPNLHEALSHLGEDPEVEVTTCKVVAKVGYRIGDRVVRAAQVLVVDPAS